MGIKRNFGMAIGSLVVFFNTAMANPMSMYSIDSNQSYLQTWVLTPWVQTPGWEGSGSGLIFYPVSVWTLTTVALSGSFYGTTQLSPWARGVGHLVISQENINTSAPVPIAFNLPSPLTFYQTSGDIYAGIGGDPFYGPPAFQWSCSVCLVIPGFTNMLSGTFDGSTLDIQSSGSGLFGLNYKIVAYSVPEPDSLLLALLGIAVLGISRRKRT